MKRTYQISGSVVTKDGKIHSLTKEVVTDLGIAEAEDEWQLEATIFGDIDFNLTQIHTRLYKAKGNWVNYRS